MDGFTNEDLQDCIAAYHAADEEVAIVVSKYLGIGKFRDFEETATCQFFDAS